MKGFHLSSKGHVRRGHVSDGLARYEGLADYAVVAGIILLAAGMIAGLLTSSGSAPWM